MTTVKRMLKSAVVLILGGVMLASCAATVQCSPERAESVCRSAATVQVYIYEDEQAYELDGEDIAPYLEGQWTEAARSRGSDKLVSITLDTQYEVCCFDGGSAMIYYGYTGGVFNRDRQYYSFEPDIGIDSMIEYVRANGKKVETKKDGSPLAAGD